MKNANGKLVYTGDNEDLKLLFDNDELYALDWYGVGNHPWGFPITNDALYGARVPGPAHINPDGKTVMRYGEQIATIGIDLHILPQEGQTENYDA